MLLQMLAWLVTTFLLVTANSSNITLADLKHNNDTLFSDNEFHMWPSNTRCNRSDCATFISFNPCCIDNPRSSPVDLSPLHRNPPPRLARAAQAPPPVDPIPPWYRPPRPVDPTPPWTYPPPRPPPVYPTPPFTYPPPRPPPVDPTPPFTYPPPRPPPVDPTPPWTFPPPRPRPPPVDPTPPWTYPPPRPPPVDTTPPWIYPPPRPPPVDPTPPWIYPPPRPPPIDILPPWIYPPPRPPPPFPCLPFFPICIPTFPTNPPTTPITNPPPTNPPTNPCCNVCPPPVTSCFNDYGKRRRRDNRLTKRQCHIDTQCPEEFSCCNAGCTGKVCMRSNFNSTTAPAEITNFDSSTTLNNRGQLKNKSSNRKKMTKSNTSYNSIRGTIPSDNSITYSQSKVNITIIFTSASQEAASFLKDYLLSFIYNLNDYINLQLIPYGKVKENGECEYGYGDCLGNWMIACAARLLPDQYSTLRFTTCLTANDNHWYLVQGNYSNILNAARECAMDYPDRVQGIYECAAGVQGFQYFLESARHQYALDHSITDIPIIALDGQIVIRGSSEVVLFPQLICEKLKAFPEAKSWCDQIYPMFNEANHG